MRLVCGDNSPVFARRDLLCLFSKVLDEILQSPTVGATLLLPEFSFLSLEVLLALLTRGSVTDKYLSKADIAEVKNLASQLGIVLKALEVSAVEQFTNKEHDAELNKLIT